MPGPNPQPYPQSCTQNPEPETKEFFNPPSPLNQLSTLNPEPCTLNPKPRTHNPNPPPNILHLTPNTRHQITNTRHQTRSPEPETLHPKPETADRTRNGGLRGSPRDARDARSCRGLFVSGGIFFRERFAHHKPHTRTPKPGGVFSFFFITLKPRVE